MMGRGDARLKWAAKEGGEGAVRVGEQVLCRPAQLPLLVWGVGCRASTRRSSHSCSPSSPASAATNSLGKMCPGAGVGLGWRGFGVLVPAQRLGQERSCEARAPRLRLALRPRAR